MNTLRKQFDRLPDQIQRDLRQMAFDRHEKYQNWKQSLPPVQMFTVAWNEGYLIMGDPGKSEPWNSDTRSLFGVPGESGDREDPGLPIEELYNQYYQILKDEVPKWWKK